MKNFFYFILAVLLCVILAGGILVATQDNTKPPDDSQTSSSVVDDEFDDSSDSGSINTGNNSSGGNMNSGTGNSGNTDGGNTDSGNNDGGNKEEDNSLKNPTNATSYIADGLEMVSGASIYLGEAEYEPAIRFSCNVSGAVKTEVDGSSNKELAFLLAPVEYFDEVNTNNYTYMDWVTAFENAGKTIIYSVLEEGNFNANGSGYIVRFRLQNINYKNINRSFVCMLVLKTTSGSSATYKYSAFPAGVDYRSNARSVAYVASAALNAKALGMASFSDADTSKLKGYINQSVDIANGKTEATDDGSMYAFTTNITAPQSLSIGQSFKLITTISPDVNIPVWYRSSDEAVIEVDESGKVTAKGKGTAVVGVYVAGESYGITVTVS
jgi:hypothetical protein